MKKSILILITILCSFFMQDLIAQHLFSLIELKQLCKLNSNDFDTYVVAKGYQYQSEYSTSEVKMYYPEQTVPPTKSYSVSRTQVKNETALAACGSSDRQWYLNIKTKVLTTTNGWRFLREENSQINDKVPTTYYHYANNQYHVVLYSFSVGGGTQFAKTLYNIQCYKIN